MKQRRYTTASKLSMCYDFFWNRNASEKDRILSLGEVKIVRSTVAGFYAYSSTSAATSPASSLDCGR